MRDQTPFSFGEEPEKPPPRTTGKRRSATIVVAVVLIGVAVGLIYHFKPPVVRDALRNTPFALPEAVTTAYKWQDETGTWQISDTPPPTGTPYERITVSSDANIVPADPD